MLFRGFISLTRIKLPFVTSGLEGKCNYKSYRTHFYEKENPDNNAFQNIDFQNNLNHKELFIAIIMGNEISYMPTDFWKFYNMEEYLNGLNEITNETGYISADNPEIQEVSELKKIENNYFKVINYKINLSFDSSKVPNKIIEEYRSHYGENSVEIDTYKNLIKIKNENAMIAVLIKRYTIGDF